MRRHTDDSYLLRLWRDRVGSPLRATLIAVGRPGEHRHFADLDELMSYLIARTSPVLTQGREEAPSTSDRDYAHCTPANGR